MKIAIMQPYFFPYLGYFQLIRHVDQFVIYDDAQYMKGGWINRNRILLGDKVHYVTLPVSKDSISKKINQRVLHPEINKYKEKIINQLKQSYSKAQNYDTVIDMVKECLAYDEVNVSDFTVNALQVTCQRLQIDTPFILSSELEQADDLKAEPRVLNINKTLNSTCYINSIGGIDLYNKKRFKENGISLNFIKTYNTSYQQFKGDVFHPFLSIIDVMMFNTVDEVKVLLNDFELI